MGAAVDISVFSLEDGSEIPRGKSYLEMSEYTPMDSPFISSAEQQKRRAITALMERHGFCIIPVSFGIITREIPCITLWQKLTNLLNITVFIGIPKLTR